MKIDIFRLSVQLGEALLDRGMRVTAAESCTGGGVAKAITDVAGSSNWFDMGFITYADHAKLQLLGVDPDVLTAGGAVSEAVVRQMASGALSKAEADLAVAVSGIAGPGGGSPEKPVGTVWFAWANNEGVDSACYCFKGDRAAVRAQAVIQALTGLLERCNQAV